MANAQFVFKGGVFPLEAGASCKFLLFLVSNGREIPFFDARKQNIISHPPARTITDFQGSTYQTDCSVVKVFLHESTFGGGRIMYSFYVLLGHSIDRQVITITPRRAEAKAAGYIFRAEGRFLKKTEALRLFPASSLQARMLNMQQMPPVEVLRQIASIQRPVEVERSKRSRALRIRNFEVD